MKNVPATLTFAAFLALPALPLSGQTVIRGVAPHHAGQEVTAKAFDEQILFTEKVLATVRADTAGRFTLQTGNKETLGIFLDAGGLRRILFAEPGKTYDVVYPGPAEKEKPLEIHHAGASELNTLIRRFDKAYDKFRKDNYNYFVAHAASGKIDTFVTTATETYGRYNNAYLENYVRYELAEVMQLSSAPRPELIRRYFTSPPVQAANLSYMFAFNNYFRKYLYDLMRTGACPGLRDSIHTGRYEALVGALRQDTLLHNKELLQLVALKGLMEISANPSFNTRAVTQLVREFSQKSPYAHIRRTAAALLEEIGKRDQ